MLTRKYRVYEELQDKKLSNMVNIMKTKIIL